MWVGLYRPRCQLSSTVRAGVDAGCQHNSLFLVLFYVARPKRDKSRATGVGLS